MTIRLVIADHNQLCRSGIRAIVDTQADLSVAAEADSGRTALEALEQETPDVLLLEAELPNPSAPRTAVQALQRLPNLAVVVLTTLEGEHHTEPFLRSGVRGIVLKRSSVSDLLMAIHAAYRGEWYIAPTLAGRMIWKRRGRLQPPMDPLHQLTRREREVCRLVAYGHTNAEISSLLHISKRTVEAHRTSIIGKLNISTRAELVRFAIDHGLLSVG
jgi:two-component system response regulator NreC